MKSFTETQKYTDLGVLAYLPLTFVILFFLIEVLVADPSFVKDIYFHIIFITVFIVVISLIMVCPLQIHINNKGIYIKYPPSTDRFIAWEEIEYAEPVQSDSINFSWRWSSKFCKWYKIKGNKGLLLKLKDNEKIFIGTQKYELLKEAMEQLNPIYQ